MKNLFYKIIGKKISCRTETASTAVRDWQIVLFVFVPLNLLICTFSFYFYNKMSAGELFPLATPINEEMESVDSKTLKQVVNLFEKRKVELAKRQNERPYLVDPAL